jgi:hypothetical protein
MLSFKEPNIRDPELIQAFDQNVIEIVVRGSKQMFLKEFFSPAGFESKYNAPLMQTSKFPTIAPAKVYTKDEMNIMKMMKKGPYAYSVIEMRFTWRTKPAMVSQSQTGGGFRQIGKLNIEFIGYAMTPTEYDSLKKQEEYEAMKFIEGLTTESLETMREEIEKYIGEMDSEEEKKEKKKVIPLLDRIFGASAAPSKGSGGITGLMTSFFTSKKVLEERARQLTVNLTADRLFTMYDIFKKSQGFRSFPYPPEFKPPPKTVAVPPDPVKF